MNLEPFKPIHREWFEMIYNLPASDEQFLWRKIFIHDQLYGRKVHPGALQMWTTDRSIVWGLIDDRMLGLVTFANIDADNRTCEIKVLIDPRICLKREQIKQAIQVIKQIAFSSGFERLYGYIPLTGGRRKPKCHIWKAYAVWEKILRRSGIEKVGLERHSIRTSRRWLARVQYETIKHEG